MPLTAEEVRRAELAPRRYGGPLLAALFALGAWNIARDEGSIMAALQEIALAVFCGGWALRGWLASDARIQTSTRGS